MGKYSATLTKSRPGAIMSPVVEWWPRFPKRLSADELLQYRRGRDEALAALSAEFGINVAAVNL